MSAGIVRETETFPLSAPLGLEVIVYDGEPSLIIDQADGSCEIDIIEHLDDNRVLVVPIQLRTIAQARIAARALIDTFDLIRALGEQPPVTTCSHETVWVGFLARELFKYRICEDCGAHLGRLVLSKGGLVRWVDEGAA